MRLSINIGKVSGTHGLKGAFVLKTPEGKDSAIASLKELSFPNRDPQESYSIEFTSWMPRGWIVQLKDLKTVEEARAFQGQVVAVSREMLPALPPNEYYFADLAECSVFDEEGRALGKVIQIEQAREGERWRISGPEGELLLPASRKYIRNVSLEKGRIEVCPFPS